MIKTYLGLDLGTKTIGVSISNTGIIASNLTTIRFKEDDQTDGLNQLLKLIESYQVAVIVLGLPKHMNNDLSINAHKSIEFKEKLLKAVNCEVILWDERLSTKVAMRALSDQNKKKKQQKLLKDEISAVLILQNYLDSKKGTLLS